MGPSRNAKQKSIKMTNTISGVWRRAIVYFFWGELSIGDVGAKAGINLGKNNLKRLLKGDF